MLHRTKEKKKKKRTCSSPEYDITLSCSDENKKATWKWNARVQKPKITNRKHKVERTVEGRRNGKEKGVACLMNDVNVGEWRRTSQATNEDGYTNSVICITLSTFSLFFSELVMEEEWSLCLPLFIVTFFEGHVSIRAFHVCLSFSFNHKYYTRLCVWKYVFKC